MQGCEAGAEGEGTWGEAELKVRKGQGLQEAKELGATKDGGAAWAVHVVDWVGLLPAPEHRQVGKQCRGRRWPPCAGGAELPF